MRRNHFFILSALTAIMLLVPLSGWAISGTFSDPGGGTYWGNVYVSSISSGKSYGWCTGDSEDAKMNEFRGFECSNNGKVTTQNPWFFFKFRYNKKQSKDYNYKSSTQDIYVMLHDGTLHKILSAGSSWSQTDKSWGLVNCSWDGEWFYVRFAPNERGIREVGAMQVESSSYYYQSNFWHSDYWFYIHARYLKGIDFGDMSRAREAKIEWTAPDKVKVSADNSWLPSSIGNGVFNFTFNAAYNASVYVPSTGKTYSTATFSAKNRGTGSAELKVPLGQDFTVNVTRNTQTSFTFEVGGDVSQNLNENATQSMSFTGTISSLTAHPNQVEGNVVLQWTSDQKSDDGEYQVYRTELNESGGYEGNRTQVGTTKSSPFTDNASKGLALGKYYRYEVFQKKNSWGNVNIPSNPEPLTVVSAAEVRTSTVPVIPLHLVQDTAVTDAVKMEWEFGNVPKNENDITFKVHRIEPGGTITRNYLDVTVPRTAGKASFSDEKPASICSNYGYYLQLDLADNKVHLYSDTVYAHVTGTTTITSIDVTKGTAGNDVIIKWKAHQVGTTATLYDVQRRFIGSDDWLSVYQTEGTNSMYSYTDNTVEPGRYYEYRVIAYISDCDGGGHAVSNTMRDVGFCRASGVVSGRVQFDTGTAVNDVRVTLSRESDPTSERSSHSRSVLDAGNAITLTNIGNVVAQGKPFTLQFFVRPEGTGTMTLSDFPKKLQLDYNSSNGLFDVKLGDMVMGTIPANEFSQVSLISDATNLTTYITGNSRAANDTTAAPQQMPYIFDQQVEFYESGNSFDGWTLSQQGGDTGWIINGDNAFQTSYLELTAYKDFPITDPMVGSAVVASVTKSSPWGAKTMNVAALCLDADNNTIDTYTICNDLSQHGDWKTYTTEFTIPEGTKNIRYRIIAKDGPSWRGYYGPCFKDMTLAVDVSPVFNGNWVLMPDFRGNVDEMRLWNRALTEEQIDKDADRYISGETEGLKAYITFDEGLEEYAFDSSLTNGVPNGHHATVGANTRPSDVIPTEKQLSSYGITNESGEYEIRGIPFTGSGTRYSVYPTKGIHSFSPTSRSAFIGGTSLTINNCDFTDVSSFKVSGTIRYSGTTIPVDSVSFYVDGTPCNKNDKLIYSDADGNYEISVPIGSHYIEARRQGHTFEGAGRYPADTDETYEFLSDTHLDFYDNTLVILAGRITGGQTEGEKPLGYGVSENTIGQAVITLTPLDHPQRMLNAMQQVNGTTIEWVANPENMEVEGASNDINSNAYRAGGNSDDVKYIIITTDAKTGEFSAKVPPIRYMVESVKFPNNSELDNDEKFMNIPAINLTNANDTIIPDTIYTATNDPLPLFKCNKKLMLTYRSNPVIDITQAGMPAGVFGTDTITVRDAGEDIKLPIYDYNETTGKVTYNYRYPIFQLGRSYNFKVRAYEPYHNNDPGATRALYTDMLRDSVITFGNELGEAALIVAEDQIIDGHEVKRGDMARLDPEQVQLDSVGEGTYKWIAGIPSLNAPYTRNMNASMVIEGQTKLWSSEGLTAIISGVVPTGNNFITAGPSHVQMVLRDPPGDGSSATWATDSVTSDYTYTVRGVHNNTELGVDIRTSLEFDILTGTAFFGKMTYNTVIGENQVSWKYDVNKTWDNHTSVTYTNSQSTSTSSAIDYVGRDGDVFIGYSTNYIIGAADKVGIFKQDDGSWAVGMQETMAMDEKFNTHFEYSQNYIETTLFYNVTRTRNTMLKHINSMSEIEENPAVPTYYTFLTADDPNYGTSNNDKKAWGAEAKNGFEGPSYYARFPVGYEGCDSVLWCNEIIDKWKQTLADNEEDKLKAFNDAKYKIGNESFERGVTVTNSSGTSSKEVHNSTEVFSTGLAYRGKNGFLLDKMGAIIISNTDIGYHQTKYDVDETTKSERFSYTLNDTQRGNAHTVDVFESPRGWSTIFRTRGGQTRCPYEGETRTKYFNEGTLLDYATMKSDNPHIYIPVRNLVDIPAGQDAQLQVVFSNDSETHEWLTSAVVYVDALSNPDGLQIFMDGEPLVNGTEMWIEYGAPITKTLTIRQSDNSILDYNDIKFMLANSCKPEKWIYETASFSAHFVPAAPDVTLKLDKNILNLASVVSGDQLVATISDINRMFTGLKGMRLKYRFAGDSRWVTAHEWVTDEKYLTEGRETETQSILKNDKPNITYNLELPNIDGNYVVVAESMCEYGNKEYVATTPEQTVIRDTRGPKLLGQAYPNTGILTPTDDIRIKFNEDIRESYLTKDENFFITGSLNDAQVSHDVSLQFNGNPVATDAYLPISNTSFAASLWLKRKGAGTIIEHGTEGNSLNVAVDNDGHVSVSIDNTTITSTETIPADKWVFLAMNYVKAAGGYDNNLSMILAEDANETMLFDEVIVPDYNANGRLTLGRGFTGMMHELVLWNKNNPTRAMLAAKDEVVAPYMPGLAGYWKMNEGNGTTVTDYARARNMHMDTESWNVENTNLAAHLDGKHVIKIPTGTISPRSTDSYVVETWFRGEKNKNARATLLSITDCMSIGFDYDNSMILHLYNDTLSSYTSNGLPIVLTNVDYCDGNWHHVALNVHRGVSAVLYIDGKAVKTIAEQQVPAAAGDYLYVGAIVKRNADNEQLLEETHHFTGDIDELRIWNAACDGTSVVANRYNQVDTAQVAGLVAYYPMERHVLDANGNIITEFSVNNMAPQVDRYGLAQAIATGVTQAATAPALRTAPLKQNLEFDFTASNNEIYINLNTLPSRMQGNLLTFIVKNVRDLQDNLSEAITWSAVVDYGTLEWDQEVITVEKDRLSEVVLHADLRNKGRESGRYNISGLPTWITPSTTTGVLGTNEWESIAFTVGADAPVGTHMVYAYAINEDDISSPLLFHVTVSGNDPLWTVDPTQFESSMNIIGQIYFDDKICTNTNTKIAAFIDGTCCGLASPKLVSSRDAYFVNLTVYGLQDITQIKPITFRIYDAEKGVILGNITTTYKGEPLQINYQPNGIFGDYNTPVAWHPSDVIEQQSFLSAGWNWISLYVQPEPGHDDLENVFGVSKVFNTIKSKEGFAMNSGTKWTTSGLEKMEVGKLYKIKNKNDVNVIFTGTMIDTRTTEQTIYPEWNWIGPLSIYNLSLNEAFADLVPSNGDIVKSKSQVAFYDGYKWEGDLTAIVPGVGYYYYSQKPNAVSFRYPTIDPSVYNAPEVMKAPANLPFTPLDHHQFSDNMNVVARAMNGDVEMDNLCIAAFIGDECRGVTTATTDGLYLLTVAGNAEETGQVVRFATIYNGEVVWFNEELQWVSDWIYGNLDEPQIFTLETSGVDNLNADATGIKITPTVIVDVVNVSAGDLLKSVMVYSANGKLLESVTPNDNQVTLNLSHLIDGVYFVEARTYSGARAVKQVIKR